MAVKTLKIAVRGLAETFPQVGSIDQRDMLFSDPVLGMEIHQAIQEERSEASKTYRAEVPVSHSFVFGKWIIEVAGRVDGIETKDGVVVCEEIKTTWSPRRLLKAIERDPTHPYALQASLYAYIYSLNHSCLAIPRLLIVSATERSVEAWEGGLGKEELEQWLKARFSGLIAQEEVRQKYLKSRKKMAKKLTFPFASPRLGQAELSELVAKVVSDKGRLMVQAPTGLGKSVGVLYPALKDALERGAKVIYATPKNSQHTVAEEACDQWRKAGLSISSVTLSAKAKICMKDEQKCNPEYCEFARSHYDKVTEHHLLDKLAVKTDINAKLLRKYAQTYEVCPYELGMQALPRSDVVICDYNYVFSPAGSIVERCNAGVLKKPKINVVVDEAHNLYARALEYFSPAVSTSHLHMARGKLQFLPKPLQRRAETTLAEAVELICSYGVQKSNRRSKDLVIVRPERQPFLKIQAEISQIVADCADLEGQQLFSGSENPIQSVLWEWNAFTDLLMAATTEFFCTYGQQAGLSDDLAGNEIDEVLQIHCCDAGTFLAERMKQFSSTIAFSATLKPFDFYARLTGFEPDRDRFAEFPSPFPRENRKILVIPQVSTTWENRAANYDKIADALQRIIRIKAGNYFVFFPSFQFLKEIDARLKIEGFAVERQLPGTGSEEARRLLSSFKQRHNMVVLAVQGGVYAEGVDLPGDQLIGCLIVGPAVPPYSVVREQMRRYYQSKFGSGFDYAYTYPAMSRVVQAAGRVIRTDQDRGIIVLLDKRFMEPQYTRCMPADWFEKDIKELVSGSILSDLQDFWDLPVMTRIEPAAASLPTESRRGRGNDAALEFDHGTNVDGA